MPDNKILGALLIIGAVLYATKSASAQQSDGTVTNDNPFTTVWDYITNSTTPDYNTGNAQTIDYSGDFPVADITPSMVNYPQTIDFGADNMTNGAWKINEYPKYAEFISNIERKYGLPTDLLARLLYQESRYRTDVINGVNRSPAGALGIAQFMPSTAAWLHVDPLNPQDAINGAGQYLKYLYNRFTGNWQYALMAYNWGEGNVQHWINGDINPRTGQPYTPPPETQNYFAQINSDVQIA